MSTYQSTHRVVVGVDDSREAVSAARFAVREAAARQVDLLLVHAYQLPPANPPLSAQDRGSFRRSGQAVLDRAEGSLRVPATMRVETLLRRVSPATAMAEAARSGSLLVLGQHHITWAEQILMGSMASRLAAHALGPVVFVPRGWRPPALDLRPVVVALDGETDAAAALQFAFDEAEIRGTRIIALHAVPFERLPLGLSEREVNLAEVLASWRAEHPDVQVDLVLVTGEPGSVIMDWSRQASIMVVGRPHAPRRGSWSRSVGLAVLKDTRCPLVLVPQRHTTAADQLPPDDRVTVRT